MGLCMRAVVSYQLLVVASDVCRGTSTTLGGGGARRGLHKVVVVEDIVIVLSVDLGDDLGRAAELGLG